MVVETEAARALVWRCAIQKDRGLINNMRETVIAKFYACRAADEVWRRTLHNRRFEDG